MNKIKKITNVGFLRWESSLGEEVVEKTVGRGGDVLGPLGKGCFVSNPGSASLSLCRWLNLSVEQE